MGLSELWALGYPRCCILSIRLQYIKHILIKLLETTNTDIVKYPQDQFGFKLPRELIRIIVLQNLQQNYRLQTLFKSTDGVEMCVIS